MIIEKPRYLSPSTISSFISNRTQWYSSKILGAPFMGNASFSRGKALEAGVECFLAHKLSFDDCYEKCLHVFKEDSMEFDESEQAKCADIRLTLKELLRCAIDHYSKVIEESGDTFIGSQNKVSINLSKYGIDIPELMGYTDFDFQPFISDMKVLSRSPSKLSQGYILQGITYFEATGKDVRFDAIITNKKPTVVTHKISELPIQEYQFYKKYLLKACKCISDLYDSLALNDAQSVLTCMSFPNLDAMWNDQDKAAAVEKFFPLFNYQEQPEVARNPFF